MLKALACLFGVAAIWLTAEVLWRQKFLTGEYLRKFGHICNSSFIAVWPWLISFRLIAWLGVILVIGALANRAFNYTHLLGGVERTSYGDIMFGFGVLAAALLTHEKIFFSLAMLHVGWADGLAALVGVNFSKRWSYRVLGQLKTIIGSMVFWVVSMDILAAGLLLGANNLISFSHYAWLILLLPPILTAVESLGMHGFDNLFVPMAVVVALRIAQI